MNKLATKLITFVIVLSALFMFTLPVYAAVAIDYKNEKITGLTTTQEYSLNKTSWFHVFNGTSKIDISTLINPTKPVSFYYREIGSKNASDIKTLTIPKRPAAPVGVKFSPQSDTSKDVITTTSNQQFKLENSLWIDSPSGGALIGTAEKYGAKFSVRTKETAGSFASAVAYVIVPKFSDKPKTVKYDLAKDSVVVAKGMEYQAVLTTKTITATGWKDVGTLTLLNRTVIDAALGSNDKGKECVVHVRTKKTATKAASAISEIEVPASEVAPTTPALAMADEKITGVTTEMEYRVLTDASVKKASHTTPVWKTIAGDELEITKLISPVSAKVPNSIIQVRQKSVMATDDSEKNKPASAAKTFKMNKRPATPKATDLTITYSPGAEKMSLAATNQYKFGTDGDWVKGSSTISLKDQIPAKGSKPLQVQIRVAAIQATGTTASTPASLPYTQGKVAATPAAPKAVFSAKTKKITGVTAKMEYQIGTSSTWQAVSGNFIDLSNQKAETVVNVKVRLKYTDKAPVSEVLEISCAIPAGK